MEGTGMSAVMLHDPSALVAEATAALFNIRTERTQTYRASSNSVKVVSAWEI
jgi:hypothetical protein